MKKFLFLIFFALFVFIGSAKSQSLYYRPYNYNQYFGPNYPRYSNQILRYRQDIGVYGYSQIYDRVIRTGYRINSNTWQKRERELLLFTGRRLDVLAVYNLTILGRTSYLRADYYIGSQNIGNAVYEGRIVTITLYYR